MKAQQPSSTKALSPHENMMCCEVSLPLHKEHRSSPFHPPFILQIFLGQYAISKQKPNENVNALWNLDLPQEIKRILHAGSFDL
jgi:hypothetical protein